MRLLPRALWLGLLWAGAGAAAQGHAHQHGLVKLDVAVEQRALTLQMQSPLNNLVGFERAPRNEAERKRVEAAVARLNAAGLFVIDPAAQCRASKVTLASAVLKLGAAPPAHANPEHADIEASFEFECQDATKAAFVELALFEAFAGMQRIEVQGVTPGGQFKRTLKRPVRRVALTR